MLFPLPCHQGVIYDGMMICFAEGRGAQILHTESEASSVFAAVVPALFLVIVVVFWHSQFRGENKSVTES